MPEAVARRLRAVNDSRWLDPVLVALVAASALAVVVSPDAAEGVGIPLAAVVAYRAGAQPDGRRALAIAAFVFLALEVTAGPASDDWVPVLLATWAPLWLGRQVGTRRRLLAALAERAAELEAEEDAFARLSVRRERARIARDLHDIVAHHLAVIVVQAGAGRIASAPGGERIRERFAAIHRAGDQALEDMARLVDLIQQEGPEPGSGLAKLRVLLDEAGASDLDVRVGEFTPGADVSPEVAETAFRVAQEGLTNAIKHAPGSPVSVRVAAGREWLELEVRDEGRSGGPSHLGQSGASLGLTGMRERLDALGGELEAGPAAGGGWALCARLPLRQGALAPAG